MQATATVNVSALSVMGALGVAIVRQRQRIAAIGAELDELRREGLHCPFTADELWRLESVGLLYDFATGDIIDTLTAIDGETVQA